MSDTRPGATTDDPAAAPTVVANPVLRAALLVLGWICVGLGAVGVVLPGWPTTVWLLVAAFFFARSSPRFYRWLLTHRLFGPIVRDIRAGLGLPARVKAFAISMIVLFAGGSTVVLLARPWLSVLVAALGLTGIVYLLRMPTRPSDDRLSRE
ncbi:MAG: YbaN family protein [Trueperaceae bacterium]|nr:YbaN family protein [Trueperaceae bacterium]